ncbi:MAG: protein kinase [Desulfobacterales bacterium]|nr:protein kinase [Desulfobacterales bacterium]
MKKKYVISKVIGTGSMATVHKAVQKSLDRFVAVKQLHPHLSGDRDYINRFEREAKAAGRLGHENILDIIDFGKDGDDYYIVTEYIDGPNLLQVIKSGTTLSLDMTLSVVIQVLNGLDHAHNKGVIHRDMKPANIMITRGGIAKITDFGIAQADTLESLTQMGQILGTPSYMSPEQAEGNSIDHRSDIFSVGVMLYLMLTGKLPFDGKTVLDIMSKLVIEPHPSITVTNPEIPEALTLIVDKALDKNPTSRFFDAGEFIYALEQFAQSAGIEFGQRVVKAFFEMTLNLKETDQGGDDTPSHVRHISASTAGLGKKRPTAAILPLTGCFGCHVNLLDFHEDFVKLHGMIDIRFSYIADEKEIPEVDLGIVEGCVANSENEERVKELREKCQTLVALGTCACFGGVPGLRNLHTAAAVIDHSYNDDGENGNRPDSSLIPTLQHHVLPVSEVVKVDGIIPGCPSPKHLILGALQNVISGVPFEVPMHNLCHQCGRKHAKKLAGKREFIADDVRPLMELEDIDPEMCFLEQGVLCMGMTTNEGCEARCLQSNIPCQGCMGPAPQVRETGAKWINAIGSLMPGGSLRYRHDIVGLAYRYTMPLSMMPFKREKSE